ncbi:MAG: translation initiation factor 2 [Clostridia bacterium]|nr:translation initiation factor 2 [Clostridia bacterium]
MIKYLDEVFYLKNRVCELENRVNQLKLSRRVLMNLIERIEDEKNYILIKEEKEKKLLKINNQRYARQIMDKNYKYVKLKNSLSKKKELADNS